MLLFILGHFLPFYPPTAQKNKILKKWKKTKTATTTTTTLDISPFYICVPKIMIRWCMVLEIWCMADVIIFSFWTIFCPFILLTTWKIKILKKCKQHLELSSFYIHVPKIMIRWCMVPEICCVTDRRTNGHTENMT